MSKVLDYGHCLTGADTGAEGCGYKEQNCTRAVGHYLKAGLENNNYVVEEVAPDSASSVNESLCIRYTRANESGASESYSIHLNSGGGTGVEIFTYAARDALNASKILENLCNDLGLRNRGIKDGSNLAMVKRPSMPAMLIECMFIDNANDMSKYEPQLIANSILKGILDNPIIVDGGAASNISNKYKPGWNQEGDGKWWYATDASTYCKNEWKNIDDNWYYFDDGGYTATNTWKFLEWDGVSRWYFFDKDGKMVDSDWIKTNGKWYYMYGDGAMLTNAFIKSKTQAGVSYYIGNDGTMKEDCIFEAIDGKTYTIDKDGKIVI